MSELSTRTARKRLEHRGAPYWTKIARGRALGYATGDPGRWKVRVHTGEGSSGYKFGTLGTADDLPHQEADGEDVLDYAQALQAAAAWDPWDPDPGEDAVGDEGDGGDEDTEGKYEPGTVGRLVQRYLAWYKKHRKSYDRTKYLMAEHVLPELGNIPVDRLTANRIRHWHEKLSEKPAHVRTSKHSDKRQVRVAKTKDERRARKVTANRALTMLKACLHRQWEGGGRVIGPWSQVRPFRGVERNRDRYLEPAEIKRLLNAIDEPEFRALVRGALYTGQRYSELARLRVADLNLDIGAVAVRESKSGKPRYVYVNEEAQRFLEAQAAGRDGDALMFPKKKGEPWGHGHTHKRMKAACKTGKIKPPINFHGLRHTYASLYLMNGGGLPDLAKQLGHSSTRMVEEHYGHLADAWRKDRARQFAPSLGVEPDNVRQIRQAQEA